jgi:hypothetical protein
MLSLFENQPVMLGILPNNPAWGQFMDPGRLADCTKLVSQFLPNADYLKGHPLGRVVSRNIDSLRQPPLTLAQLLAAFLIPR